MVARNKFLLEDVCSRLSSGKGIKAKDIYAVGKYPVYGGNGIRGYADTSNFNGECAVIGRQGANCGNVHYFSGCGYMTEHAIVVQANEKSNTRYLAYLLSTMHLGRLSGQSAQPGLSVKVLSKQKITLPSISIQDKIASVLSALDNKILINEQINKNLEEQALSIFRQEFIYSNYSSNILPLYDFAYYVNGAAFKQDELGNTGLPVIKIAELKSGITNSTRYYAGTKNEKYLVTNGDILFSWSGNPDTSIDVFIWSNGDGILNQHTFNVKSKFGCPWFTYLLLKYHKPIFTKVASNKQTTGLGHVTAGDLKRIMFPFNLEKIQRFEDDITPFMDNYFNNLLERHNLENLRDVLLPKLMSSEVDVTNIDI